MDFHPFVANAAHSGIKIPLYDNAFFKFDPRQPFSSYPSQKGLKNFVDDIFNIKTPERLSAVQSWLFFGLMTEIFDALGVELREEDFIVEDAGSKYITTRSLRRYLWYCIGNLKNMLFDEEEGTVVYLDTSFARRIDNNEMATRVNDALETANGIINQLLRRQLNLELEELVLSIMCLVETLGDARSNWDIFPNHFKNITWEAETIPLLTNLLLKAGWCPEGVRWLYNRCSYISMLYFITFFDQRTTGRDHRNCTAEYCAADDIHEETYVTKHVKSCECQHAGAEVGNDIVRILEKGEIPVLAVSSAGLTVTSASNVDFYIAISHVWSDGLGNPHTNSLPFCQLLRLQRLVDNLNPNPGKQVWFWMDTICVPLIPSLRNKAIRRMADVYQDANLVLVLESSLMTSSLNISKTELLARIKCSPWTRRLWTFQEGMLARNFRLVFQFQDGYFHMQKDFPRMVDNEAFAETAEWVLKNVTQIEQEGTISRIQRAIAYYADAPKQFVLDIEQRFPDFPTSTDDLIFQWLWRNGATTGDILFMDGWNTWRNLTEHYGQRDISALGQGLKNRKTSKPEDECICLGTLLGIDVQPLFAKSGSDRMKHLFQLIDKIRPAIIFSDGPRIDQDGFRWAPSSFLRPEKHPREPGIHGRGLWAERHQLGLLVNFDGFLLPQVPVNNIFTITDRERAYTVRLQAPLPPIRGGRMAIIHELRLWELEDEKFSTRAILVEITNVHDDINFSLFSTTGRIVRAVDDSDETIEIVTTTSSKWCVG